MEESEDIMSKVIDGKTLEECAAFAKRHYVIDTTNLEKWLKNGQVKQKFKNIFGGLKEYDLLKERIDRYKKM